MGHIYEKAKDLHVVARFVYAKASDAYAYSDVACTVKIPAADLKDMFEKGAIVVDSGEYKPVSYVEASGVGTLTYVKTNTTTATTADLATLKSSEYAV